MPEDLCACDHGEAPDLAAWKREAGEAAPLDAAATRDWRIGGVDAGDGRQIISGGPVPIAHIRISCVTVGGCDGSREITPEQRDADARFAAAARTGWPRDAARVGVLCAEVERLRVAINGAADAIEHAIEIIADEGITTAAEDADAYADVARLRALAAGGALPKGESR